VEGHVVKKAIFTTLAAIIAFSIYIYFRLGMNKEVALEAKEAGPFKVLYLKHTGPYFKIAEKIDYVEKWAKANGVACEKTFGQYIDDPKVVDEDRLQSQGGCIISELPKGVSAQEEMILGELPKRKYLIGSFNGAPSVGPYTVYPKAFDWMKANTTALDGAIIEIYNVVNEKEVLTEYLFPIK
jgi:AraC family transcriptional regulator